MKVLSSPLEKTAQKFLNTISSALSKKFSSVQNARVIFCLKKKKKLPHITKQVTPSFHQFFRTPIQFTKSRLFLAAVLPATRSIFRSKIASFSRKKNFMMISQFRSADMLLRE